MTGNFLIRTGAWGEILGHRSVDATVYSRGQRVICETWRGLEIGEVISSTDLESSGRILRPMTYEDELLQQRLAKHKCKAVEQCRQRIAEVGFDAVLLDVEHLFDGKTLYFHFLGDVPAEIEQLTNQLAIDYEKNVRSEKLHQLLTDGCGPGCGTDAKGCSGACAVCVVAAACKTTPA